jgi:uncharacterized lipoprotein YajG
MRIVVIVSFAALLGGCAFATQAPIAVKPDLVVPQTSQGAGKNVQVVIADERAKKTLGTRGVRGVGSELTVAEDFPDKLRTSIEQGLQREGFKTVAQLPPDGRELKVEIRDLEYSATMGFWAGTLRTNCALHAACQIGQTRPYEKLFRGEHEESIQVVQGEAANTGYVNDAVSKAVNALVTDPELLQCLASVPGTTLAPPPPPTGASLSRPSN